MATHKQRRRWRGATVSSTVQALAGIVAAVLAGMGLTGTSPLLMAQVCAIVLGVALTLEGVALSVHYLEARRALEVSGEKVPVGSGVSAEFLAGAAAVVLGALALLGIEPLTLAYVAVIVLGAGLLFGGGLVANTSRISGHGVDTRDEYRAARAAAGAGGAEGVVGAGAIVLGILAVIGVGAPLVLALAAHLALGIAVVLSGTSLAGRLGVLARDSDQAEEDRHHGRLSDHYLRET